MNKKFARSAAIYGMRAMLTAKARLLLASSVLLSATLCVSSLPTLAEDAPANAANKAPAQANTPAQANAPAQANTPANLKVTAASAPANFDNARSAVKDDVVMQAMLDELERTTKSLKLPDYPLPYYSSFFVTDEEFGQISAGFGALNNKDLQRTRRSEITLRVGDKQMDNTTIGGGFGFFGQSSGLVREDNYDAIRRDLWMQADRAYKQAVESLTAVKAHFKYINIEDRPDVFSDAKPVVSIKQGVHLTADLDAWAERMRTISAIFKDYPEVRDSAVNMNMRARTKRLLNSDGTAVRYGETGALVYFTATAQAKDGMTVSDHEFFAVETVDQLPSQEVMEKAARNLCERVKALASATRATDYQGPILFEKQAAGELMGTMLPPLVVAKADGGFGSDDEQKLDKPVINSSMSVFDDPMTKDYQGKPLKSGWEIDYEGVPAEKLQLIVKGKLKAVCSTRTPSRVCKVSNGHSRGGSPSPGHLFVSTDGKTTLSELRTKLQEMGKKDELESVLIVRRIVPNFLGGSALSSEALGGLDIIRALGALGGGSVGSASQVYKLDLKTGKEELIRGARLKSLPRKNLLTMEAASDDADTYVVSYPTDHSATTISLVTPSVLLKDVEIAKPPRTTELPPYLENPYFEEHKK